VTKEEGDTGSLSSFPCLYFKHIKGMRKKCRSRVISQVRSLASKTCCCCEEFRSLRGVHVLPVACGEFHTDTVVKALSATLQKICGANISTNATIEVKVAGENGQGKPEEKVHVDT